MRADDASGVLAISKFKTNVYQQFCSRTFKSYKGFSCLFAKNNKELKVVTQNIEEYSIRLPN